MSIFDAIASGRWKLTPGEDALIWQMRAAGWSWPAVETAIYDRRERFMRLARQNHRRNLTREAAMRWRARQRARRECST